MLKTKRNPDIMKKLLDQSHSLGKLIKLLDSHKEKEGFPALITGLTDIKASIDILNSENTVTHEAEFEKLVTKVEKLRNEIVNDN
jgi:predicted CopG family antitoxin